MCMLRLIKVIRIFNWQAVTNPLQAFFNAIVYQSWNRREKLRLECCQDFKSSTNIHLNAIEKRNSSAYFSESSPLLNPRREYRQNIPHISINGSSSLWEFFLLRLKNIYTILLLMRIILIYKMIKRFTYHKIRLNMYEILLKSQKIEVSTSATKYFEKFCDIKIIVE